MTSCAWLWIYLGTLLVLLELLTPGFIICFFGLGAATVGVLRFLFGAAFDLTWQLAAFSFLSVLYIVFLRRFLRKIFTGDKSGAAAGLAGDYVGRHGRVTERIAPNVPGRVLIGDAAWTAEADGEIPAGTDVKVVSQHNLTMKVEVI